VPGASGTINVYANALVQISFTPDLLVVGNPVPTRAGTLTVDSELKGQYLQAGVSLPAGLAPDNDKFQFLEPLAADGTVPLWTRMVVNQTSFTVLVQADVGLDQPVGGSFKLTAVPPLTVTIAPAAGQPDPSGGPVIHFTVVFSAPVSEFTAADLALSGLPGLTAAVSGVGTTYDVAVSGMGQTEGPVTAWVPAGVAHDASGAPNLAAPILAGVYYTRLTVTISRAAGQPDPSGGPVLHFAVVFSAPVSDFTAADVNLNPPGLTAAVSGAGTTYDVAVSGMGTAADSVTAWVPAGVAHDASGAPNLAALTFAGVSYLGFQPGPAVLVGNLGTSGLWEWSSTSSWYQLSTDQPREIHTAADGTVVASFGSGLWRWTAAAGWAQLSPAVAAHLETSADATTVIGDFPGSGLWRWTTTNGWRYLGLDTPDIRLAATGDLFASYSTAGLWRWSPAGGWDQLSTFTPDQFEVSAAGAMYARYFSGLWRWSPVNGSWANISFGALASSMAVAQDGDLFAVFGDGLWRWTLSGGWLKLSGEHPSELDTTEVGGLFATFHDGIWNWTAAGGWLKLPSSGGPQKAVVSAAGDYYGDFGGGLWRWTASGGWTLLSGADPQDIATAL
jgi:hypothetical protein